MTRPNVTAVKKLLLFTVTVFHSLFLTVSAQWPGFKTFPLNEDKKAIRINTLFKNETGYLFAGTTNGLYKFDGSRYTRIYFENKDYTDTVTAIFRDKENKYWVGFNNGRIAHIINGKLKYFNPEEGTPAKKITAFLQDKDGNTWFSTAGEGIYYIKKNRIYLINEKNGLNDLNINSISLTPDGEVLAATDQGLNLVRLNGNKTIITHTGPGQGLPDYIVTALEPDDNNQYWIGMQDKGFCSYDTRTKKIVVPQAVANWNHGQVYALLAEQHLLWIATELNGLMRFDSKTGSLIKVKEAAGIPLVKNLLKDIQGNIWLSSTTQGLVRTPGTSVRLDVLQDAPVFEHIHAILCDKKGDLWVNDQDNNIVKYQMKDGLYVPHKISLKGLDEKIDITSLFLDIHGNIWIGTMGKGIYILDPVTEKYRMLHENSLFQNASILSISGKNNAIFASSLQGAMIIELTGDNKDISAPYQFKNYDNSSTGTNYIYSIFRDNRNRTWFATDGRGLTMMQQQSFTFFNDKKQVKDDHIYSITEDRKGNIWFSTAGAGIYKYDGSRFTNFQEKDGLSDMSASILKTDSSGNIIIVHKKGLDILDPETGNISYINNSQGIGTVNAEDLGAATLNTEGNVMVSTSGGILTYRHPSQTISYPVTVIESVQLFLNDIAEKNKNVFSHDENNFTFNYTGLYYTNPDQVLYQYKLEGFDSSWVFTNDKSKTFPRLEPGKYTFRIRSSLNNNFRNASEASYQFTVKKAFYKTYWFIGCCLLLCIWLLYVYIRSRERSLKKLERLRQEKIQFRFEVLRNQVNPHFLFNSFNTLISTIEDNPKMAVEYVEQLSEFFRNIVTYRDKDIISLQEELNLLQTYVFLQQKRYGDSLNLQVSIHENDAIENYIPPLTLQLLVENAIKHNAVSKESALTVGINIAGDRLVVKNNINPKQHKDNSSGMGLQNIINRYNILTSKQVQVTNDNYNFVVTLPLIKKQDA